MDDISKTEWAVGGILLIVFLAIAVFLNPFFKSDMLDELKIFEQSVKNENDPALFAYERNTNVGNVLAYGQVETTSYVKMPELNGEFSIVRKNVQKYTRHTKQVCASRDKKGNCSSYRTEVYYSWDSHRTDMLYSESYIFLGEEFKGNEIDFPTPHSLCANKETISAPFSENTGSDCYLYEKKTFFHSVGDLRYSYDYLPTKFNASIFFRFMDGKVTNPTSGKTIVPCFYEMKPSQVVQGKKDFLEIFDWIYYMAWALLPEGLWLGFAYKALDLQ